MKLHDDKKLQSPAELFAHNPPAFFEAGLPQRNKERKTFEELYRDRRSGVLMIGYIYKCKYCPEWHVCTAGGFVISKEGLAITNYHVLSGSDQIFPGVMTTDGQIVPIDKVLAVDKTNDVALIKITAENLHPVPLAESPPPGADVAVISHPREMFYTLTKGIISRYYFEYIDFTDKKLPRMEITANFTNGSSGCPVFDIYGNIAGMVVSASGVYYTRKHGKDTNLQMIINICVPVDIIRKIIRVPKDTPAKHG